MKHTKEGDREETKHTPTLKEGAQTRVMLRELTILNTEMSRNQEKILPEMAKIGGGDPSTIWKGNVMECK